MKALWQFWPGLLADQTCDEIIAHAFRLQGTDAGVGGQQRHDPEIRDSQVRWIWHDHPDFLELWPLVERYFEWANRNAFGVDARFTTDLQFTTYREERLGHYQWHQDTFVESNNVFDRKLSMVIQLSDPGSYQSGDLELDVPQRPCPKALRERGSVIVFPSIVYHRVVPVTKGTRHSLVAWREGPPWR